MTGLILATNEGRMALLAPVTIDCTGDAIVSTLAGAHIEKGREDGLMQPVTLEFTIDNVDETCAVTCIGDVDNVGDERRKDSLISASVVPMKETSGASGGCASASYR